MEARSRVPAEQAALEVVILGSNILGPQSLTEQGFDWATCPTPEGLTPILSRMMAVEGRWADRIRQWEGEGAMGDVPMNIAPGAIAWAVTIDSSSLKVMAVEDLIGEVARHVQSREPHARIHFQKELAAEAMASRIISALRNAPRIQYRPSGVNNAVSA
jgi:hypothetical protein